MEPQLSSMKRRSVILFSSLLVGLSALLAVSINAVPHENHVVHLFLDLFLISGYVSAVTLLVYRLLLRERVALAETELTGSGQCSALGGTGHGRRTADWV